VDAVWTEEELAEHLKVPTPTVKYWRSRGTGPKWFRAGKYVRYRESAIREWEAGQEDEASARASA
jgi:DNA-binding transcriptional MerR regulator